MDRHDAGHRGVNQMKRCLTVTAFVFLTVVATITAAPLRQAATDAEIASRADALMSGLLTSGRFNGTVLLARNGRVVFEKGYGMANFEWDIPNTSSTKFRLGSITKQFTSMAIMQLEERGLLKSTTTPGTSCSAPSSRRSAAKRTTCSCRRTSSVRSGCATPATTGRTSC